jgi:hypothetical protein
VAESLAGRVGILQLGPLSITERLGLPSSGFIADLLAADSAAALQDRLRQHMP